MAFQLDTSEFDRFANAIALSARATAKEQHFLVEGTGRQADARVRQAFHFAQRQIIRDVKKPVQQLAVVGAPRGTKGRLQKPGSYSVFLTSTKKGKTGFPKVKAGPPTGKRGTKTQRRAAPFSNPTHAGWKTKKGSVVVGEKWMYKRQPQMVKLFANSFAKHGERFLTTFWERKTRQVAFRPGVVAVGYDDVNVNRR